MCARSGAESEQHDPTSPCPLNPSRSTNPWLHQSGPVLLLDGKEDRASEDSDGEEREQLRGTCSWMVCVCVGGYGCWWVWVWVWVGEHVK